MRLKFEMQRTIKLNVIFIDNKSTGMVSAHKESKPYKNLFYYQESGYEWQR
jgi:hypothetical protein